MPQTITLAITMDVQTGSLSVNGPIHDKTLAYGLLELARDAIYDHHKQQDNRIVPVSMGGPLPPPPGQKD